MKKIEAFQLSDGTLIIDEQQAIILQKEIDSKRELSYLCEEFLSGLEYYELADEIYRLREKFIKVLQ